MVQGWAPTLWSQTPRVQTCLWPCNSCVTLGNLSASSFIKGGTRLEELLRASKEMPLPTQPGTQQALSKCQLLSLTRHDCGTDLGVTLEEVGFAFCPNQERGPEWARALATEMNSLADAALNHV